MNKYRDKFRSESHRKPLFDYSTNAIYFLTIVTQNRVCNLGEIIDGNMILSDFGRIVEEEWYLSFEIRSELLLHKFVIMPNHLHTIVEINNTDYLPKLKSDIEENPIIYDAQNQDLNDITNNNNGQISLKRNMPVRQPKSISSFMAGFKSSVNTQIDNYIDEHQLDIPKYNKQNHFFIPNYHDHIIRDQKEYDSIAFYILNNPKNWNTDSLSNP